MAMIDGLSFTTKDETKIENDSSHFYCGPFGTDLQVIVRHKKNYKSS